MTIRYRCWTVGFQASPGIRPREYRTAGGDVVLAVLLGEEGRGRHLAAVAVQGAEAGGLIEVATPVWSLGETVKLVASHGEAPNISEDFVLAAITPEPPERGRIRITGDIVVSPCPRRGTTVRRSAWAPFQCPECYLPTPKPLHFEGDQIVWVHPDRGSVASWRDFPGRILVEGRKALGLAARQANARQLLALLPVGAVIRVDDEVDGVPCDRHRFFRVAAPDRIEVATLRDRRLTECW